MNRSLEDSLEGSLGGAGDLPAFTANLSYAAQYDKAAHKRFPSAGELCSAIRLQLLALRYALERGQNPDVAIEGPWDDPELWAIGSPGS